MSTRTCFSGLAGFLTCCAAACLLAPAFAAPALDLTEFQITMSPAYETTPTLGNDGVSDLVVYTMMIRFPDYSFAPADIWYQRVADDGPFGPCVQVTADLTDDQLNDVSGDYIVYTAFDSVTSMAGTIMLYRISTRERQPLARAEIAREPRIHGNHVVWVQGTSSAAQIMLYDLAWLGTAQQALTVAGPIPPASQVQIGSRYVVWTEYLGGQYDVQAFDLNSYLRMAMTASMGIDDTQPSTYGDWIVWQSRQQGSTTTTIEAFKPSTYTSIHVANNGAGNFRPSIDGDLVAWESNLFGNLDIFIYRFSTGETFRATSDPYDQYLNDVFGNKVAYVDERSGNEDVWVTVLDWSPVAAAGADLTVYEGSLVTLDGSGSYDLDGDPLSYTWTQIGGTLVTLVDAGTAAPTFVAPAVGLGGETLTFRLVVEANSLVSEPDVVNVAVRNVNQAPFADAGPAQTVSEDAPGVVLDGSGSFDPDGDALVYAWTQTGGPTVILRDADSVAPSFDVPQVGPVGAVLTFRLVVDDGALQAQADTEVTVLNVNVAPVAEAGPPQTVDEGTLVQLDGSASYDPDGDPLSYLWTQLEGSAVLLDLVDPARPRFTAPLVGPAGAQLLFQLEVDDGVLTSAADTVVVTVLALNAPPNCSGAVGGMLWPPDHALVPVEVTGIVDPDGGGAVAITYDTVFQDEPLDGLGDGDTSPDAVVIDDRLYLRAERSSTGDGRFYHVHYTATDDAGASCSGVVTFVVPRTKKAAAVDGGELYLSLAP